LQNVKVIRVIYGIGIILSLAVFLLPWFPNKISVEQQRAGLKLVQSSLAHYTIGNPPGTGLTALPFSIPYVLGLILGFITLIIRPKSALLPFASALFIFIGVITSLAVQPAISGFGFFITGTSSSFGGIPSPMTGWYFMALILSALLLTLGVFWWRISRAKLI
jgi:hypothetical protein